MIMGRSKLLVIAAKSADQDIDVILCGISGPQGRTTGHLYTMFYICVFLWLYFIGSFMYLSYYKDAAGQSAWPV